MPLGCSGHPATPARPFHPSPARPPLRPGQYFFHRDVSRTFHSSARPGHLLKMCHPSPARPPLATPCTCLRPFHNFTFFRLARPPPATTFHLVTLARPGHLRPQHFISPARPPLATPCTCSVHPAIPARPVFKFRPSPYPFTFPSPARPPPATTFHLLKICHPSPARPPLATDSVWARSQIGVCCGPFRLLVNS